MSPMVPARVVAGALAVLLVLAGCQVLASTVPSVTLAVASLPDEEIGFAPTELSAPANTLTNVTFNNVSTVDHNLVFLGQITARTSAIIEPGRSETIQLRTPEAGVYTFQCTIHEEMKGTLIVTQ
jgi:plastocyanin